MPSMAGVVYPEAVEDETKEGDREIYRNYLALPVLARSLDFTEDRKPSVFKVPTQFLLLIFNFHYTVYVFAESPQPVWK